MASARAFSPRKQPRQQRSLQTVAAILQAAEQVFARHGYAHGTTNRIAARAGVSIGSLYEYFPNKDALLVALIERHVVQGEQALTAAVAAIQPGASLQQQVQTLVSAMIELHASDRDLHRVLFEEAPRPAALRRRLARAEEAIIVGLASFLAARRELSLHDPTLAAQILVRVVEGLVHRWAAERSPTAPEQLAKEITKLVCSYLTSR